MKLKKVLDLLRDPAHQKEIEDSEFEKLIIDAYLKGGADAVKLVGELFARSGIDLEPFKDAVIKIGVELLQLSGQL